MTEQNEQNQPTRDAAGRWLPGIPSPNPSGRPADGPGKRLRDALEQLVTPEMALDIIRAHLERVLAGDAKHLSLLERSQGMLVDRIDVSGAAVRWNWQPGGAAGAPAAGEPVADDSEQTEAG